MSIVRNFYLAVPLMLGLSACTPTKTFVFVNSPKDLEYKLGDHEPAMQRNVNRGIDNARKDYLVMHASDFNGERRDYRSDKMPQMNGRDMDRNGMHGMGRMNDMQRMDRNNTSPRGRMPNMYGMHSMDTTSMNGMGRGRMNGMQRGNMPNNVSHEDMMKYGRLMNDYKDMPEAIGEMMPMSKVNAIRNMDMNGMRGMRPMDRMHNMYRGASDSSMFRPHMRNDTAKYDAVRNMYRMQHMELMKKNMPKK